jgi:uncharacterized protein (TIGR02147 family)
MVSQELIPKVIGHKNYRDYLQELYLAALKQHQRYSYRKMSQELGLGTSNYLHLVIKGRRNLSDGAVLNIQEHLPWFSHEKKYFFHLVKENQALTPEDKKKHEHELQKLLKRRKTSVPSHLYFSHWYLPIIREIIALKGFVPHLGWITRKLKIPLTEKQVLDALKILEKLHMIEKTPKGWKQADEHLTTDREVASDVIFKYHEEMLELSKKALTAPPQDRDYSLLTMSLSKEQFLRLKEKIQEFRADIQHELQDTKDTPTQISQLNIQFFKLTDE